MRSSVFAPLLAFAAAGCSAQYLNQTAPFNLVLLSSNGTINGTALGACHEGAAIEGLCLGGSSPFQLNYTASATITPSIGVTGLLTYWLQGGNFYLSSPMELSYNPTSNVAVPLFTPGEDETEVAFGDDNLLGIPNFGVDDTIAPANTYDPKTYYRWYVCDTYVGYAYTTLAWVMGDTVPENPTCQKVDVLRVYI